VLLTTGRTPARGRLWANTVVQYGRSTNSGDASAVFVIAATSLELRDNLLCYAGADSLGVGLWVNDPARLGSLVSDTNWVCARDALSRHLAWAGHRVTSTNWGRGRGSDLGLLEDFAGAPLPSQGPMDIGAFQAV
jgi:hypothetical protein